MAETTQMTKGALAVELAHEMVLKAFPMTKVKAGTNERGLATHETVDGPFWGGVDRSDSEAVKERLREMAGLIGELALMIEVKS